MEKKYYYFPITEEETMWFSSPDLSIKELQIFFNILVNTERPDKSDYHVLIVNETNPYDKNDLVFFCCLLSEKFKKGMIFVLGGSIGFYTEFISSASRFLIPKKRAIKILDLGFNKILQKTRASFYDKVKKNLQMGKRMKGFQQITLPEQDAKEFDYESHYRDEIESYVNDFNKQIKKQHMVVEPVITRKRRQLLQRYVYDPSLSVLNVSRKNRPIIQEKRKQHQKQLLETYGKSIVPIPQQQHPIYRQKIMEYRDKEQKQREQKQKRWMEKQQVLSRMNQESQQKTKKLVKQLINEYGDDYEKLVEEHVLKNLGLLDPITYDPIQNPILLPSSSIADQSSAQKILRLSKDPITNQKLPQDIKKFQVDPEIHKMIQAIEKSIKQNLSNQHWTPETRVYKLHQLLEKWKPLLDQKRIKRTKTKYSFK